MHVLTIGTFDPFHAGHAYLLKRCREMGDKVTVGVLSDGFVEGAKGVIPQHNQNERLNWFHSIADEAYIERGRVRFDGPLRSVWSHPDRILKGDIDVVAVGSDWATRDYYERLGLSQAKLDTLGVTLAYVPRYLDISATEIKERAR